MRAHTRSLASLAIAMSLVGCQDTEPQDAEGGWTVEPEVTGARPLSWCAPSPVPYDVSRVPALPEGVAFEGFCDAPEPQESDDAPTSRLVMNNDARVLTVLGGDVASGVSSEETFTFDAQGRVVFVTRDGTDGFYGAGEGSSSYELDAHGEVVHKVAAEFGATVPLVKHQEWEGDRLLWRTERAGEDGPMLRRWAWTWEDDALVRGELVEDPDGPARRVFSSQWTYHDGGAPASVERRIEGELVEREAWTLREDGTLESRTIWSRGAADLAREHGGEVARWALPTGLDDHQLTPRASGAWLPWEAARSHADVDPGSGCARLPRGPHGYPAGEEEYHLGVGAGARPSGIGAAYGADTFMWSYGDDAWFGHDGVASGWPLTMSDDDMGAFESTLEYDTRGTMTREVATFRRGAHLIEITRGRALDEAGRVLEDALEVSSGEESHTRTLEFERDARGSIVRRTLRDAGGEERAAQTWSRDQAGRVTRHAVARIDLEPLPEWAGTFSGSNQGTDQGERAWFWRYEGAHLVERGAQGSDATQTLTYDASGRLIERVGEYDHSEGSDLRVVYDDKDRVVRRCQGSGGWMSSSCVQTTYDEAGRVIRRVRTSTFDGVAREPELVTYNLHVCE